MLQILVAEDNRGDILLVQEALIEHKIRHELHIVTDGEQAIQFLERMGKPLGPPLPDVVLLDLNLPKADGSEVLERLRRQPNGAHLPVIVVTSSAAPKDQARVAALGISGYFRKPSQYDEFMRLGAMVRQVMGERGGWA